MFYKNHGDTVGATAISHVHLIWTQLSSNRSSHARSIRLRSVKSAVAPFQSPLNSSDHDVFYDRDRPANSRFMSNKLVIDITSKRLIKSTRIYLAKILFLISCPVSSDVAKPWKFYC